MQSPPNERAVRALKRLIWAYFVLLIIEGALRKWVVPTLSDPLLVIRDPVAIACYLTAIKARVFPSSRFVISLIIIGGLSWIVGVLVLQPYLPIKPLLLVTIYGLRSNFLHLPLIWIIAKVFDKDDVEKMGKWFLLGLIPMALLMVAQFNASPDSFINRTAGSGEALQITAGGGKIRPPATFSFISGVIFYAAAAAAFLLNASISRGTHRNWLLFASGLALVVATGVSGSRSVLLAVLIVVASIGVVMLVRPRAINSFGRNLLIVVAVGLIASRLPVFKEGVGILSDRFTTSAEAAETTVAGGLIARTLSGFTEGFTAIGRMPVAGYGLGIGTNAGAKFLTGRAVFLLSEAEWARILLESGPILGLAFIVWRVMLVGRLGYVCLTALREGSVLPIMLYSSCFITLLNGQFGQPTNLGFATLLGGLCLASTNTEYYRGRRESGSAPSKPSATPRRVGRRSAYAERMHQPQILPTDPHGAVDR